MRIAFDHQIFFLQAFGGISRYFTCMAAELSQQDCDTGIFAPLHCNAYLAGLPRELVHGYRLPFVPRRGRRLFQYFNQVAVKGRLASWRPDVVHETYYAAAGVAPRECPVVVTVYDMIHELFPEDFAPDDPTPELKRRAVERADHVICISESTRRDLIRLHGVRKEKLSVVHLGFNRMMPPSLGSVVAEPRPFLLYVGNRAGYKNFAGMLHAVASSPRLAADFDVIAFGGGALTAEEKALVVRLGLSPERVRQVDGGDDRLGALYRRASAFVYPSLYEGFGLPPLEAMAQDCPVVSSHTSSMPEVIGGAAAYFDPFSADDMAAAIERVVYDDVLRADLRQRGARRLDSFSWGKCAQETLAIYCRIGGGKA